jgi:2',3'-cyclic-nucleotide 2'-phosphodiesterase / 3'-nucleotidase
MCKKTILIPSFFLALTIFIVSCSGITSRSICILETTDIHGVILPYDFIEKKELKASLASSFSYVRKIRKEKDVTVLLDNGDNLQGQPEVYFYNFVDTVSPHFMAAAMNYMGYDAGTAGNHDIEAGHAVYDRLLKEYNFPVLAANAVNKNTGEPYFKPYCIIKKKGICIAVMGLITPSIPDWLPPKLYSGMEFRDMAETAKIWMPRILMEKPDIIVGLFHSGWDRSEGDNQDSAIVKNGSRDVAYNVPGFDIIFTGHDHKVANEKFVNSAGKTVLVLNGGSKSEKIAQATILLTSDKKRNRMQKVITGQIINSSDFKPDNEFISGFAGQQKKISEYVSRVIGRSAVAISSRDAFFGPSAFVDMIHSLQLKISGADISFTSPLSFDVNIPKGPVTVGDMFKLYRYENLLYTMSLSGNEVLKYLEYSYSGWYNTMHGPDDTMLKFRTARNGKPLISKGKTWLENQPFNFDSAAGIDYTVDLTKPPGERISVTGFTDGRPFIKDKCYKVALNSFRGNGGGGHLTNGAGIGKNELSSRFISSTERDLRYFVMKSIEAEGIINPVPLNNWKIIPEKWIKEAKTREYNLLFGNSK